MDERLVRETQHMIRIAAYMRNHPDVYQKDVAKHFGVTAANVSYVARKMQEAFYVYPNRKRRNARIIIAYGTGLVSIGDVADLFGLVPSAVAKILHTHGVNVRRPGTVPKGKPDPRRGRAPQGPRLPTPDLPPIARNSRPTCTCGTCLKCRSREAQRRAYYRRRATMADKPPAEPPAGGAASKL